MAKTTKQHSRAKIKKGCSAVHKCLCKKVDKKPAVNCDTQIKKIKEYEKLIKVIERAKHTWQATFDAIKDPVLIISKDHIIERANISAAAMCSQDIRNIIGKKCFRTYAGRNSVCSGCPIAEVLKTREPQVGLLEHMIQEREYEVRTFPLEMEEGDTGHVVVHYHDVTEERRLQQEVIQQEKMAAIGMLAGGVAHEINNPLGGILAFCQLILKDLKEGDPLRGDMEEIERAAIRCKKIVADLLDFSRLSSGREKQWVDLMPLIERVLPFLRGELKSQNIDLKTELDVDLPRVYGDPNRLQQVFLNLLTNACHAMKKGGTLTIKTAYDPRTTCMKVIVQDTGAGIPKENLKRIFDPFFTTKMPGSGTGLGLSISYRIVRDHGGRIEVESTMNKGSTFTVRLPTVKGEGECHQ